MGVIKTLQDSYRIAIKDLTEFERNRIGLLFMCLMPFFMLIMTGYIFPTGSGYTHIPVGIVDEDHSGASAQLVAQLEALNNQSNAMDLTYYATYDDAKDSITRGSEYGAIIIPANYSAEQASGRQSDVIVLTDNSQPQLSMITESVAAQAVSVLGTYEGEAQVQLLGEKANLTIDNASAAAYIAPIRADQQGTVAGSMNYFSFVAPGLLMMIVMMGAMTGIPRAIAHEKEIGTFDGILAAPVNEISIILGKTLAQTVRGFAQGIIVMVIAMLVFGVTVHGSLLLTAIVLLLGIFSFIGLGILLTALSNNEETAMIMMTILQFPMMFLTGVFFPIQQMPWFMQDLSKILPLTYAVTAMRKVMILGAGVQDIMYEVAILVIFGAVMLAIAIPVFRRAMTR